MVRVFQTFALERKARRLVSGITIDSALNYTPRPGDKDYQPKNDAPWVRRFAAAGGRAIICNDSRMMRIPHERLALVEAGLVVLFFESRWNQLGFTAKCSHLMFWWERIYQVVHKSQAPSFWRVPQTWDADGELYRVPHGDIAREKIERQIADGPKKAKERAVRRGDPPAAPLLSYQPPESE